LPSFTKQAIVQAFIDLLNEEPLNKITVTDIVNRCGVNRNTFYYYFQDIYALVDELLRSETERFVKQGAHYDSWADGFRDATKFALENRQAIFHIYKSVNRELVERYLYDVSMESMRDYVREQAKGLDVAERDIEDISVFYAVAIDGLIIKWLEGGMKEDPDEHIGRINKMLDGSVRAALEKSLE
jgi:AcrR family transcriptional regulator